ncbi:hypothetical protein SK128_027689 [Halocaridina rubra]|uniref:C2H2-type domain-containing protein n=1 Tax=Halocaridina rubra TaxID=373956 RepID=A0AAN8ZQU0_HALRR
MEDIAVEEEDLLYLDYYLNGKVDFSPNNEEFSHCWSPVGYESTEAADNVSSPDLFQDSELSVCDANTNLSQAVKSSAGDNELEEILSPRKNRGVAKPRFVSYTSFPPVKGKPYLCKVCGKKLASRESCRRHVLTKHSQERPFVCNHCGKSFIFNFALKSHTAIHSDVPIFVCVCGMNFKLRSSYMNHIQRIHRAASEVKFSCELCFKSFGDRHTLRLHMVSVHKPKTIPCIQDGCKKVFSSVSLMHCHYRYHQNLKYKCDKCDQSFSTESYMNKHRLSHLGVRPYTCVECGKSYLSASHLNQHYRMRHTMTKSFQCYMCGSCYRTKNQLKYHENNHRGEKPYKCEICGYATAYKNTLYAHRKKRHSAVSSDLSQKQTASQNTFDQNASAPLEEMSYSKSKKTLKKTYRPIKPKVTVAEENSVHVSTTVAAVDVEQNVNSSGVGSLLLSSPSFSSSSPTCLLKPDNIDLIIISSNVVTTEPNINESFGDISLKCSSPGNVDVACKQNETSPSQSSVVKCDMLTRDISCNPTVSEPEKDNSLLVISKNGRCAVSECDSKEDSLLLVRLGEKFGDNSYAGICGHHLFSGEELMSELNLNSFENLMVTTLDPKTLECSDVTRHGNCASNMNLLSGRIQPACKGEMNNTNLPINMLLKSDKKSEIETFLPGAIFPFEDQSQIEGNNSVLMPDSAPLIPVEVTKSPLLPVELSKPSISVLPLNEVKDEAKNKESMILYESEEEDTGIATLSGHIIDDSFRLAQLEVVCPLCDEQFYCMDTYITHLDCCHN